MCKEWEDFRDRLEEEFEALIKQRTNVARGNMGDYLCALDQQECLLHISGQLERLQWVLEMMPSKELQCP